MEHAEQDDEPISLSRRYADWIPRPVLMQPSCGRVREGKED